MCITASCAQQNLRCLYFFFVYSSEFPNECEPANVNKLLLLFLYFFPSQVDTDVSFYERSNDVKRLDCVGKCGHSASDRCIALYP